MATTEHQIHEGGHPTPRTYVTIAAILAVITAIEVAIVMVDTFGGLLVPILLLLSAGKFALVVGYFMHLKFDSRLFSALFIGGFLLATAVLLALVAIFDNFYLPA